MDEQPKLCPSCGLLQARLKRIDHYFALFFIPLFRVKEGKPFLECRRCGIVSGEPWQNIPGTPSGRTSRCPHCGYPVESTFRYCPYCGRSL